MYGVGGLLALLSFGLLQLIIGYSLLEGGAGDLGAAAGPLIGGVVAPDS
ncbi:MAG: hypothetical protein WAK82_42375 [Streptosporangiaceae bacterium]